MKALMKMPNGAHTHEEALEALKNGQPIVFPTDTLFGLGVSVLYAPSPDILYAIKHREKKKPIAWLVGGIEDLERYGKMVPDFAFALARTFWPGPLTVIVKASDEVPAAFCSEEGTIGPVSYTHLDVYKRQKRNILKKAPDWHRRVGCARCRRERAERYYLTRRGGRVCFVTEAAERARFLRSGVLPDRNGILAAYLPLTDSYLEMLLYK